MKSNKGAAGVDEVAIDEIREYGEVRFLSEIAQELRDRSYRVSLVRRVHIAKTGQPGKTRPLGIPTVKDRVAQMAVKLVIEPVFEADFMPCSFGFRPEKTPRMALSIIAEKTQAGYSHVVDVDLKSYFDTIDHELLMQLVGRRVGDVRVLRLIRAWLKAGVMEEGRVTHPDRGSPQGGVIESDPEWVVYLFPGRQQQPDLSPDRLGRAERAAVMAPTQTSTQLAVGSEALELSVPV